MEHKTFRFSYLIPTLCSCFLLLSGCGGGGPSGPSGTVSGTVILEGQPVGAGHTISFTSPSGSAAATIEAGGKYSLKSGPSSNIPVGNYKVNLGLPAGEGELSDADYEKMMAGGKAANNQSSSSIPSKFLSPTTSGITYDIKEGENSIDIDLK